MHILMLRAALPRSADHNGGAMLQAGVNPQAQVEYDINKQTIPVSGASVAKCDNVLVTAGVTTAEVEASCPEHSHPVSLNVDRNLQTTLICNLGGVLGGWQVLSALVWAAYSCTYDIQLQDSKTLHQSAMTAAYSTR